MKKTYKDIHGWFNFENFYSESVYKFPENGIVIEVGSWLGKSAIFMAEQIAKRGIKVKFDCIDIWEYTDDDPFYLDLIKKHGNVYNVFLDNISDCGCNDLINPIKMESHIAADLYDNESVDFVFIDANHHYDFVMRDIECWYPKVKSGGVIAGHDYDQNHNGVIKAVSEFFGPNKINKQYDVSGNCWIYNK